MTHVQHHMMPPLFHLLLPARRPDLIIGPADNPYLERWHLVKSDQQRIYLHHILRSDDDRMLHDHPAHSISLLLHGSMAEMTAFPAAMEKGADPALYLIQQEVIHRRRASDAHRLILYSQDAWTLFITGPIIREWGFWVPTNYGRQNIWVPNQVVVDDQDYSVLHQDWQARVSDWLDDTLQVQVWTPARRIWMRKSGFDASLAGQHPETDPSGVTL